MDSYTLRTLLPNTNVNASTSALKVEKPFRMSTPHLGCVYVCACGWLSGVCVCWAGCLLLALRPG